MNIKIQKQKRETLESFLEKHNIQVKVKEQGPKAWLCRYRATMVGCKLRRHKMQYPKKIEVAGGDVEEALCHLRLHLRRGPLLTLPNGKEIVVPILTANR